MNVKRNGRLVIGSTKHHVVLVPGLFGFARLGGFDYFMHVEAALERRFAQRGASCDFVLVSSPPTASIVRRTQVLIDSVSRSCGADDGPIHLIGHSTGGLDVRFLACPTTLPTRPAWFGRVETVTTVTTPHFGTPLAYHFTTMAGTRLLEALSFLTYLTLRAGGPPLTVLTPLIASLGRLDLGVEIKTLEKMTDMLLAFLGEQGQAEVREWFARIHQDQGAIIQLTPESMDIFSSSVEDDPGLRYGCVLARVPRSRRFRIPVNLRFPTSVLSSAVFSALYTGAGRVSKIYPPPAPAAAAVGGFGEVDDSDNDGLVPTTSMPWGDVIWAGTADHLDVLGHFDGGRHSPHTDWLVSGARFRQKEFGEVMDAIAGFLLSPG